MTLPITMRAMVTMGHGDMDQIVLHTDWPRPDPAPGEVLIEVRACGLNNTDVNTRSGWYSKGSPRPRRVPPRKRLKKILPGVARPSISPAFRGLMSVA